jgi:hypothetical protein
LSPQVNGIFSLLRSSAAAVAPAMSARELHWAREKLRQTVRLVRKFERQRALPSSRDRYVKLSDTYTELFALTYAIAFKFHAVATRIHKGAST